MKIKIKIKDSKTLLDSINDLKKKIKDAEPDLTKAGVKSIANALLEKKEEIGETKGFAELRDIVKEVVGKFDTPKSREILTKVEELNRLYNRDPRPGSRNDYWVWEKLMKYIWNIILKASGNPSPDVRENKTEDACAKDEEDDLLHLARLLGEAHDKVMEALDLANTLEGEGRVSSDLVYDLEDLEAETSRLDFMGEGHPEKSLLEAYPVESDGYDGEADDWDI